MCKTERWGNFSYPIPAWPRRYAVVLHFAARHPLAGEAQAVEGVFNVFCNGRVTLGNFDLTCEAQHRDVVVRRVTDVAPNAQGKTGWFWWGDRTAGSDITSS